MTRTSRGTPCPAGTDDGRRTTKDERRRTQHAVHRLHARGGRHIRGLYAGEAAFVDHCLGRLFDALRDLGYYEDSVIVLTADHGHPLADHGKFLKGGDRMYSELLREGIGELGN